MKSRFIEIYSFTSALLSGLQLAVIRDPGKTVVVAGLMYAVRSPGDPVWYQLVIAENTPADSEPGDQHFDLVVYRGNPEVPFPGPTKQVFNPLNAEPQRYEVEIVGNIVINYGDTKISPTVKFAIDRNSRGTPASSPTNPDLFDRGTLTCSAVMIAQDIENTDELP